MQFGCNNLGPNLVTLTAADSCGNSSSCTSTVEVQAPSPICRAMNATTCLDANGIARITPADIDGGSTSTCGAVNLMVAPTTFDCADLGSQTITLTVTSDQGLTTSCTATVSVEDKIAPTCMTEDVTIYLDKMGMASLAPEDVFDADICDDTDPIVAVLNVFDTLLSPLDLSLIHI